jgi:hypothetical protein
MSKILRQNFSLPSSEPSVLNSELLLPPHMLEELKTIASPKVVELTLRAVDRAGLYESRHPFWNAIANSYIRIIQRIVTLRETYPDIKRVIHNAEVKTGDILVSDPNTGLNFGYMSGGSETTKIIALENKRGELTGMVLRQGSEDNHEVGSFKNEIWYFISHKFTMISNKDSAS